MHICNEAQQLHHAARIKSAKLLYLQSLIYFSSFNDDKLITSRWRHHLYSFPKKTVLPSEFMFDRMWVDCSYIALIKCEAKYTNSFWLVCESSMCFVHFNHNVKKYAKCLNFSIMNDCKVCLLFMSLLSIQL